MIEMTLHHYLPQDKLIRALNDIRHDPSIAKYARRVQADPGGLAYRFSGPSIAAGFIGGVPASPIAQGHVKIKIKLKGLAALAQGKIAKNVQRIAVERLERARHV